MHFPYVVLKHRSNLEKKYCCIPELCFSVLRCNSISLHLPLSVSQWVSQWVIGSFRLPIASTELASLFFCLVYSTNATGLSINARACHWMIMKITIVVLMALTLTLTMLMLMTLPWLLAPTWALCIRHPNTTCHLVWSSVMNKFTYLLAPWQRWPRCWWWW